MQISKRFSSRSRRASGWLLGCLWGVLVGSASLSGWLDRLDGVFLDVMFQARANRFPDPRITLLVADDATVAQVGKWPIPRRVYADVVKRLDRAGARTIAFDVLFPVASSSATSDDLELERACSQSKRVVQAAVFHVPELYSSALPASLTSAKSAPAQRFSLTDRGAQCLSATWASTAMPGLLESAPAMGHVNVFPESDGALRRVPLIRYRSRIYPSLALASAAHFLGLNPQDIIAEKNEVHLVPRNSVPRNFAIDSYGETPVNWIGGNGSFPTYNFNQLFEGRIPAVALKDRLVLIGITAAGAFESRATPFSPLQPAVELQANAIDDILSSRPLREINWLQRWTLLLLSSTIAGVVIAPRRLLGGLCCFLFLEALLWRSAVWLMGHRDLCIPVATPMLSVSLVYIMATALNYRREWEANWRVDAAVDALARGGALMASGRDRDALLRVIQNTAREVLSAREVQLVINKESDPKASAEGAIRALEPADSLPEDTLPEDTLSAPLAHTVRSRSKNGLIHRNSSGVLKAIGRQDGHAFDNRDRTLLATLADQASLALDNLEYYEMLRDKVDLANSDLREAYQTLDAERAKLIAAIESNDGALIVTDEYHHAILANPNFVNLVGPIDLGQSVPQILEKQDLAEFSQLFFGAEPAPNLKNALDDTIFPFDKPVVEVIRYVEISPEHDLIRRVLHGYLTWLENKEGRRLGAMLVIHDVTHQHDLGQMKDDFISYLAHELRSPLSTINGYASLLQSDELGFTPIQRQEMLVSIEDQCSRVNRLVNDLTEIIRMESGQEIELSVTEFDLAALCERIIENHRALLFEEETNDIAFHCSSRPLLIRADVDRIEQVMVNLLGNSLKYSPHGGQVSVTLSEPPDALQKAFQISVSDEGIGMTKEQMGRVFEKYYRSPEAQALGIKGTGLGLYFCKRLIEAHGGSITVESEHERGSTFTLVLPANFARQASMVEPK
jgi:signal transduction histidine kinase/CHASE2 domain-containing sensor protein